MSKSKKQTKKNLLNKKTNIPVIERKYCSCLQKVRSEQYAKKPFAYKKTKKALRTGIKIDPRGEVYSEYAICNKSVYQSRKLKRDRVINCSKSYDFNNFTLSELQAYALDKNMPITEKSKNLTKKQLLNNIKLKIEQVD